MLSNRISSLKSKSDFRELVTKGKKAKAEGWLTLDYIIDPEVEMPTRPQLQFGLSISRKIGSAVIRNRIKRWTREFFRRALRESNLTESSVKLNLRLRENGEFYKNLRHSEFDIALGKAWGQIKKYV